MLAAGAGGLFTICASRPGSGRKPIPDRRVMSRVRPGALPVHTVYGTMVGWPGAAKMCGTPWCAIGRPLPLLSPPSILRFRVGSPAGVTGKSSLICASSRPCCAGLSRPRRCGMPWPAANLAGTRSLAGLIDASARQAAEAGRVDFARAGHGHILAGSARRRGGCRRPRRSPRPEHPRTAASLGTRSESTAEIRPYARDQEDHHGKTAGPGVRARLPLARVPERRPQGRRNRPRKRAADRGTARHPRRDTRATAMPEPRQHHHENRIKDQQGTESLVTPQNGRNT